MGEVARIRGSEPQRGRGPAGRRAALAALLALGFLGCGRGEPEAPPRVLEDHPLPLLHHLDAVAFEGLAEVAARDRPVPGERELLSWDFEDGSVGPLRGFRGEAVHPGSGRVVRGPGASREGSSLRLRADPDAPWSLRSPPLAVRPGETYRLRYRVATLALVPGQGSLASGGISVLSYRMDPAEAQRTREVVRDPAAAAAARLLEDRRLPSPRRAGTHEWSEVDSVFRPDPRATHLVLSLDLYRPTDDSAAGRPSGAVWLDDVVLTSRLEPLGDLYAGRREARTHPLRLDVALDHPAHAEAGERRQALYVPAPSAVRFRARIPEAATLSLGYGLLPDAPAPDAPPVRFTVEVVDAAGRVHRVHRDAVDPPSRTTWTDAEIDLSRFAGQTVGVALRTEGRAPSGDPNRDLTRPPEAAAVWSAPVFHSRSRPSQLFLVVVIDTLPARRTSTYGYARETTPELTRIAAAGVRFERALVPSPWTLPTVASLFTGFGPGRHGAGSRRYGEGHWRRPLASGFVTLAERFDQVGWETRAWINNPNLTARLGLHQGFTGYLDYGTRNEEGAAEPGVADLERVLGNPRGQDRFYVFHLMDPHGPYRPGPDFEARFATPGYQGPLRAGFGPGDFRRVLDRQVELTDGVRRRVRELYEASIAYTDAQLGRLYAAARAAAAPERLVFAALADHGEELWEHGRFEHGHSVYDELLRVPMVVVGPGFGEPGRVVATPVAVHDLAPTLLELAGLEVPEGLDATSLLRVIGAEPASPRALPAEGTLYGVERISLEREGLKYVYNQLESGGSPPRAPRPPVRSELYSLRDDPGETRNLVGEHPGLAQELHEELVWASLPGLAGDYVVVFEAAGGGPRELSGTLTLPPHSSWVRFARDFLWPSEAGPGRFEVRAGFSPEGAQLRFRVEAERAILAFRPREGSGPVSVSLALGGEPLASDRLLLGGGGTASSLPVAVSDADLWVPPEALLERGRRDGPHVLLARVALPPERLGGEEVETLDDDLRAQLEALGYLR